MIACSGENFYPENKIGRSHNSEFHEVPHNFRVMGKKYFYNYKLAKDVKTKKKGFNGKISQNWAKRPTKTLFSELFYKSSSLVFDISKDWIFRNETISIPNIRNQTYLLKYSERLEFNF